MGVNRGSILALVCLGAAGGCRRAADQAPGAGTGRLELSWSDSTGPVRFAVPAGGRWCAADSLLEIVGARRDTAFGIVLLAGDSALAGLGGGVYSAMPGGIFIPWRPRSQAALHLAGIDAVRQYESAGGQVEVTGTGPAGIAGTFELQLVATTGPDSLRVTGSFRAVRAVPVPAPCGRADRPPPG